MLIDDVKISVTAGKGGDGLVTFNKNKLSLGPTGGDGGKGGDVFFQAISNIGALSQFRNIKSFKSEKGQAGGPQRKTGRDGKDLILKIPVGTVIHNLTRNTKDELTKLGQQLLVAKGGEGGRGNFFFRSSRNTTPKESEPGKEGESFELRLELKLIADIGLIGIPSAGKSTLLNELTNAQSKVANYPFTTLEPHLGVYYELILADLPGLIEGASEGKGLGIKFLRHIERTKTLFHLVPADAENPLKVYHSIRKELGNYDPKLLEKKEFIFLSKSDTVSPKEIRQKVNSFAKEGKEIISLSVLEEKSLKKIKAILNKIKKEK